MGSLEQTRTSNAVNEITDVAETTGPSWMGASLAFAGSSGVGFLDPLSHSGFRVVLDPEIGQKGFQFG